MEAGEGCACVERDPQPFGDARGGRRFEPWERTISLLQCKEKSNQVCKVRRFGIPANMAGFSSIPRAHMTPSTPVAARTCAASARERTSPLAKTGIRTAWEIDGAGGDSWKSLLFRKAVTHWHNRQRKTQEYKGRREWWTELSSWNVPNPAEPYNQNGRQGRTWGIESGEFSVLDFPETQNLSISFQSDWLYFPLGFSFLCDEPMNDDNLNDMVLYEWLIRPIKLVTSIDCQFEVVVIYTPCTRIFKDSSSVKGEWMYS